MPATNYLYPNSPEHMTYGGILSYLRAIYTRDLSNVQVAVSGIPYDGAVTNRSGARMGPRAIRAASTQLAELHSFPFGFNLFDHLRLVDYGDCMLDPHHPETLIESIENHITAMLDKGVHPVTLGGDHFVTYPILRAIAKKHGPVCLLHFDAHCDTWEDDGNGLNHGTMFLRAKREGLIDVDHSIQVGIRTYNDSDHGFMILTAPWVHRHGVEQTLQQIYQRIGNRPVYVTFDIDCVDPAFAPGTGTPVVGGLSSAQALELMRGLGPLNSVGMDLVEVAQVYDVSEITAILGATLVHDYLCLLAEKNGAKRKPVGLL
ncbi:agmatinase [Thiolinea disciformis]|uniref:agmatinase n=1 Tax=Thiolinea disciformis TaxID=125614 RepID=UPI00037F456D|nr:agmatinase [Thiolinea disciformis]